MSERGLFIVDRGIFDHPDLADEPFTEREAWLWLIAEAAFKDHSIRGHGGRVDLARGQLCHSVRFLADKWRWSKSRVGRFLLRLKNRDMIRDSGGAVDRVITICNYEKFQAAFKARGGDVGQSAGQQRDTSGTVAGQRRTNETNGTNEERSDANASDAREAGLPLDAEFADWYARYPHKVGKAAALKAFRTARRRADLATLRAGLERYIRDKPPDRPWCNPATWLNQERWNDQPAVQATGGGHGTGRGGKVGPATSAINAILGTRYGETREPEFLDAEFSVVPRPH